MSDISSAALALGMIASFLLAVGGVRMMLDRQTRARGALMLAAAAVMVTNVMVWTV